MSLIRRSIMRMWLFVEHFRSSRCLSSFLLLPLRHLPLLLLFSFSSFVALSLLLCLFLSFSLSPPRNSPLLSVVSFPLASSRLASSVCVSLSRSRGSPGPEVVMSASVARPVASRRIVANDDVTLEISRPVIQVVSLCTA